MLLCGTTGGVREADPCTAAAHLPGGRSNGQQVQLGTGSPDLLRPRDGAHVPRPLGSRCPRCLARSGRRADASRPQLAQLLVGRHHQFRWELLRSPSLFPPLGTLPSRLSLSLPPFPPTTPASNASSLIHAPSWCISHLLASSTFHRTHTHRRMRLRTDWC